VLRRRLRRAEVVRFLARLSPCLVGMEACAGAVRTIAGLGYEVRLMPPAYVKAYVRRQKNDLAGIPHLPASKRRSCVGSLHEASL
jgi:transposase